MNFILQERYQNLDSQAKAALHQALQDSPMAMRLLSFLDRKKGAKFSNQEVVRFLYEAEPDSSDYPSLQNRFFKLRKKVLDHLNAPERAEAPVSGILPLEQALFECRNLVTQNFYEQAVKSLRKLHGRLLEDNIFELLPDTINLWLYAEQAMNNPIGERLPADALLQASALLHDFRQMQVWARILFDQTRAGETEQAQATLTKLSQLARKHPQYPRFKLFYHQAAASNSSTWHGYPARAGMRHIQGMKRIMDRHPDMPGAFYELNHASILRYYHAMALGMIRFRQSENAAAYKAFLTAWDIQTHTPNFRLRKTEAHFHNKAAIEVALGRYREAIRTMEELIEFLKTQHLEENRLRAFGVLATTYTYAFPQIQCPDPAFLLARMDSYITHLRQKGSPELLFALASKGIFCFMLGKYADAAAIARMPELEPVFALDGFGGFATLLQMTPATPPTERAALKRAFEAEINKASRGDVVASCQRAIRLLEGLSTA